MLIAAEGLVKRYRVGPVFVTALDHVDLRVQKGDFTVLAGRSGSGKTTLLNILGALDVPDEGRLWVAGTDLTTMSKNERAEFRLWHVGFVFQSYNLIRVLTARENVAYVLQLRGVEKRKRNQIADRWLAKVGLAGLEDRRPDQLSGGQQQRVAVARALAPQPDLVLADEPTANLDTKTGGELIQLMRQLNEELGTTFVIASHDQAVMDAAGVLLTMRDGRLFRS